MKNPYEVLGIKEGASIEEIKAAYKEQVKKYHPDLHQDNPLYELAQEKLQEINEAYDYLMKNAGRGGGSYGSSNNAYSGNQSRQSPEFRQVRIDIDRGNLKAFSKAYCSEPQEADLPAQWTGQAYSNRRTAAPCCWTKSAPCPTGCRGSCFVGIFS